MFRMIDSQRTGVLLSVPSGLVLPQYPHLQYTKSLLVLRLISPSTLEIPASPTLSLCLY